MVDLGRVTIGETTTKIFELDCEVPVEFDYKFSFDTQHYDITISPMSGEISKGKVPIEFCFTPSTATTAA